MSLPAFYRLRIAFNLLTGAAALAVLTAPTVRAEAGPCCAPPAPPAPPACEVVAPCPDPCASPWKFAVGLNLSAQTGNTETLQFKVDGKARYDRKPWLLEVGGYYVYGEQAGVRNAENGSFVVRGERYVSARDYVFGQVLFETDDFAALEYRLTPVVGYGRVLVKTSRTELKGEVGGGLAIEKRDLLAETTDPIAWLALHYVQKVMKDAVLSADLDVRPNLKEFDRTVSVLDVKFECPLCKWMSLVLGVRLRHEVEPPAPLEKLDTLFTVGLKLTF